MELQLLQSYNFLSRTIIPFHSKLRVQTPLEEDHTIVYRFSKGQEQWDAVKKQACQLRTILQFNCAHMHASETISNAVQNNTTKKQDTQCKS